MASSDASFQTIRRASVVDEVIESFKQALIQGKLRPGQRLPPENELAQQFGVGRSAIREAMKMLEALGVISINQGNGTYIAQRASSSFLNPLVFAVLLESGATSEILDLRVLIQAGYCQLAAQRATPEDWQRIYEVEREWESNVALPEQDIDRLTQMDLSFHYALLDATHNPLVIKIGRAIEDLFFASIRSTLSRTEWRPVAVSGHRSILAAMKAGQPEAIRVAVLNSLSTWGKVVNGQVDKRAAIDDAGTAGFVGVKEEVMTRG